MVLLAEDDRSFGERLNDFAGRLTVFGAEVDAAMVEATRKPLNATVTDVTASSALLHWTPVEGSTAYIVGRDGKDNRSFGTTTFVDPATSDRRLFVWLLPQTTYHVFVLSLPSGVAQTVEFTTGEAT
jgi:hypothetical protein